MPYGSHSPALSFTVPTMESLEFRCKVRFLYQQCLQSNLSVEKSTSRFLKELQSQYAKLSVATSDSWVTVRFSERSGLAIYSPKKDEGFESDSDHSERNAKFVQQQLNSSSSSGANSSASDTEEVDTSCSSGDFLTRAPIVNILSCHLAAGFTRVVLFTLCSLQKQESVELIALECSSEESARILINVSRKFTRNAINKKSKDHKRTQMDLEGRKDDNYGRYESLSTTHTWSSSAPETAIDTQRQSSLKHVEETETVSVAKRLERPLSWNLVHRMDENGITHLAISNTENNIQQHRIHLRKTNSDSGTEGPLLKLQTPGDCPRTTMLSSRKSSVRNTGTETTSALRNAQLSKSSKVTDAEFSNKSKVKSIFDGCEDGLRPADAKRLPEDGAKRNTRNKTGENRTQPAAIITPEDNDPSQGLVTLLKADKTSDKRTTNHASPIRQIEQHQETHSVTTNKRGRDKSKAFSFLLRFVSDSASKEQADSTARKERGRSLLRTYSRNSTTKQRAPSQPPPQSSQTNQDVNDNGGSTFLVPTKSGADASTSSSYPKEPHFVLGANYMVPVMQPHPILVTARVGLPTPMAYAPALGLPMSAMRQWWPHENSDTNNNSSPYMSNQFMYLYPAHYNLEDERRRRSRSQSPIRRRLLPPTPQQYPLPSLPPSLQQTKHNRTREESRARRSSHYNNGPSSLECSVVSVGNSVRQKKKKSGNGSKDDGNSSPCCDPRKVTFNAFATVQLLD